MPREYSILHPSVPGILPASINCPHGRLHHGKRSRTHRHRPEQSWPDPPPKPHDAFLCVSLCETLSHAPKLLLVAEAIGLHLALDHVERIAPQPQHLACQTSIESHLVGRYGGPLDAVPPRVGVHEVLKGKEPPPVGKPLAPHRHHLAPVEALEKAATLCRELPRAVEGAAVQPVLPVRLGLQPDAHVLDRPRDDAVGYPGEGPGGKVLPVRQGAVGRFRDVLGFEPPPGLVEGSELDRHAGTDAEERGQRALVESEGAFGLVDGGSGGKGVRVAGCGLEADLDDIEGLTLRGWFRVLASRAA